MFRAAPLSLAMAAALMATPALCATVHTQLAQALPSGPGPVLGTATVSDSPQGAVILLDLHGLPAGQHGLHLHQNASCAPGPGPDGNVIPAGAAGGHWDPAQSGHHLGPTGQGHRGDLPRVDVGPDGTVRTSVIAPHITDVSTLKGHALMIHVGGDNYTDTPPLGGGGPRLGCGVVE